MRKFLIRIKDSFFYKLFSNVVKRTLFYINPKIEINRAYKSAFGKYPNLENPLDLIEKIYWFELNSDTSLWSVCSDKFLVRDYIAKIGLEKYLPKILAKWDSYNDIDLTGLPNQFVIKSNNGCGDRFIVKNKNDVNLKLLKKHFKKYSKIGIGYDNSQIHYLAIKSCIIAEELIIQDQIYHNISPKSLIDFKFWCFDGNVECCFIAYNRDGHYVNMDMKDNNWNSLSVNLVQSAHLIYDASVSIPKPDCFDEMKMIASKLSKGFPEVRIDMFISNGKPVIGEMTFSSGYGYLTYDFYKYLGSKVVIKQ